MFRGGVDPGGPSNGTGGPPPPTRPPPLSNDITLTFVRLAFEPNQSERTVNALDYDAIFRAIMDAGNELYPAWDGEENREEIYCLKYADTELRFHVESIAAENKVNKRADIMRFMEAGTQFWADPQKINPFRVFLLKDYVIIASISCEATLNLNRTQLRCWIREERPRTRDALMFQSPPW